MERKILVIGAGRSSASLIDYLLNHSKKENWTVTVADIDQSLAEQRIEKRPGGRAIQLSTEDKDKLNTLIEEHDTVVSMLPASMHADVAERCLHYNTNMLTASYVSEEMQALDEEAKKKGLCFINEIGVDPGIDHLSAKKVIDRIEGEGGELKAFETFTGGLVAPEFDNNPWNYKFTWNPRNVVLAGAGGAVKFIENGQYKYIPYHRLFRRTELIEIEDYGRFEGYANRDSLKYRSIYGLENISTMYRGTLRRPGFCKAWNVFVQLGATDDTYKIENSSKLTYRQFINSFLKYNQHDSVELKLMHYLKIDQDEEVMMNKLQWLDIFEDIPIVAENASPAQILQEILERKWKLENKERDMIVMWHKFIYNLKGEKKELHASMVVEGDDHIHTAMAKTVGLPLAICTRLLLNNNISAKGVVLPVIPEIYNPVLDELETLGISFKEKEIAHQT